MLIVIRVIISQNKGQVEMLNQRHNVDTIIVMSSGVGGAVREAWLTELWRCLIEYSIPRRKIRGQATRALFKQFSQN